MGIELPKTRNGRIVLSVVVVAILAFLFFFTTVFEGHAVEVTVHNTSDREVFVSIDNSGRHGESIQVVKMPTTDGFYTPEGLRITKGQASSFGMAVGLGDSPTLHIWPIKAENLADQNAVFDCPFDTVNYGKLEIPSIHKRIEWDGKDCKKTE